MTLPDPPLTVAQLAKRWQTSTSSVYGWIRTGRLAAVKIAGGLRIPIAEVRGS